MIARFQKFVKQLCGREYSPRFADFLRFKRALPFKLRHGETYQERKVEWSEIEAYLQLPSDLVFQGAKDFFAKVIPGDEIFEICSEIEAAQRLASYHGFEIRREGKVIDRRHVIWS